jgi:predicted secreted protein
MRSDRVTTGVDIRANFAAMVLALALLAGSAGCVPLIDDPKQPVIQITEKDAGATVDLERNQQLWVRLVGNRTTGFQWLLVDQTGGILEAVGEAPRYETDPNPLAMLGVGGTENWIFQTVKSGSGLMRFEYRRPWENGRGEIHSVVFNIKVR